MGDQTVFDLETIFLLLLVVGQQRQLELENIFQYELCAVPSSLIDEYGCFEKAVNLLFQDACVSYSLVLLLQISSLLVHSNFCII